MKVKHLSKKLIDELKANGFTESGESYDRNILPGQDFRKDLNIDGRDYTIIFGIHQAYNFWLQKVGHDLNGQLVLDVFPNDGEYSPLQSFIVNTTKVLMVLPTLDNLWK